MPEPSAGKAILFGMLFERAREQWPSRNQLLLELARSNPIVFLQGRSGSRRPGNLLPKGFLESPTVVIEDSMSLRAPFGAGLPKRWSRALDGRLLHRAMARVGVDNYLLWQMTSNPRFADGLSPNGRIYDCIDPNFIPETQKAFDAGERAIARESDVVFATARALFDRMRQWNDNVYLLPNGVDEQTLTAGRSNADRSARADSRPVVGYLGTVDWRFDAAFVGHAARARPDVTFAIVGRVNSDMRARVATLAGLPNVVMPGQVGFEAGLAWLAKFDVGIVPFIQNAANDAVNPVKVFTYLAFGLPIVATATAENRSRPYVDAAETPGEFASLIAASLANPVETAERMACAEENSWSVRARQARVALDRHGLL